MLFLVLHSTRGAHLIKQPNFDLILIFNFLSFSLETRLPSAERKYHPDCLLQPFCLPRRRHCPSGAPSPSDDHGLLLSGSAPCIIRVSSVCSGPAGWPAVRGLIPTSPRIPVCGLLSQRIPALTITYSIRIIQY